MKLSSYISISLLLLTIACSKDPSGPKEPKPVNITEKNREVISNSNDFGINLFRETATTAQGNMMLSPLSASTALSMLLNGCASGTYTQIRDMLGYEALSATEINETYQTLVTQLLGLDPEIQLALANAVFYSQDFSVKSAFLNDLQSYYSAETASLNFSDPASLPIINNWASDHTNGKITHVLNEISPYSVMFLMNALYFKGTWTYQFDKSLTGPVLFYPENENARNVDMMTGKLPYKLLYTENFSAFELPYGQQNFAMDVIVPHGSLHDYIPTLNGAAWQSITDGLDAQTDPATEFITMPKFRFDYEKVLNDQLTALGMTDAFDYTKADLTGISDDDLYVSFVKQNTFVDVNEEGTEAAAVTTIGLETTSAPEPVVVNKPFIFAIRERLSNTLLFIGKVELPAY